MMQICDPEVLIAPDNSSQHNLKLGTLPSLFVIAYAVHSNKAAILFACRSL